MAKGYDFIMPDAPQRGVRNFFRNLAYPVTFLNLILQGKVKHSIEATGRFVINTTVGVLGFFDVATKSGIPQFDEDFGQTLARYGTALTLREITRPGSTATGGSRRGPGSP